MKQRIDIKQLEPAAYEILLSMEKYLAQADIPPLLIKLMKIRASQINKCAYCIAMHTTEARKMGEEEQRIYALSAWEESPHFLEEEKAVLRLTEEVTLIGHGGLADTTFQGLQQHYSDQQIAQMIIVLGQINFWNRIAVTTLMTYTEA